MTNWQTKKLGEIIVENKKSTLKSKGNKNGNYPFFVSGFNIKSINQYLVDGNNIYLPTGGSFFVHYYDGEAAYSTDTLSIRTAENVDMKYLYYFLILKSDFIAKKLFKGATIKHLQKQDFKNLEIIIPSTEEQKSVVMKLDGVFEEVTKAKEAAEDNLQNSKEFFESYLQSVFANPGKDWGKKKLGEVCDFYNGKAHEKAIDANGAYIVINSKFVSSNGEKYKKTKKMLFPLTKGDIAMVMSDVPNGKTLAKCFIVDKDNTYSLNQRICAIRSNAFEARFLFFQLNRHKYLLAFNNGENQTNLRKNDILSCPLFVPSRSEQNAIIKKLDALLAETKKLEKIYGQKLADLEELKKSVLQQAFTGKL